ncbi:uncharacterized protein LOC115634144 [Scaptodrosophila lebanonensis]|uniref:Uncharacterized protein LOC115634144 n=1 Tax=Drosophila lebanonensis TaxID=7225 RepID=A0A6J2UK31_DROLE|nr:uncharacterized protein LOC115634144 [Scaptodrosophila lebanonensis]
MASFPDSDDESHSTLQLPPSNTKAKQKVVGTKSCTVRIKMLTEEEIAKHRTLRPAKRQHRSRHYDSDESPPRKRTKMHHKEPLPGFFDKGKSTVKCMRPATSPPDWSKSPKPINSLPLPKITEAHRFSNCRVHVKRAKLPKSLQEIDATGNVVENNELIENMVLEAPILDKQGQPPGRGLCHGEGGNGHKLNPCPAQHNPVMRLMSFRMNNNYLGNKEKHESQEHIVLNELASIPDVGPLHLERLHDHKSDECGSKKVPIKDATRVQQQQTENLKHSLSEAIETAPNTANEVLSSNTSLTPISLADMCDQHTQTESVESDLSCKSASKLTDNISNGNNVDITPERVHIIDDMRTHPMASTTPTNNPQPISALTTTTTETYSNITVEPYSPVRQISSTFGDFILRQLQNLPDFLTITISIIIFLSSH